MASLANAITLSANSRSIMLGTQIHGRILKLGFSNHIFMLNNLIKMYSRCGVFSDGLNVFDGMPERNLVSWTLIVFGVVKVCTYMRAYMLGLCVHSFSLKVGMEKNSFMGSSILHMYAKFGFIEVAEMVSEEKEANCRDLLHQLKQRAVEQRSPTQVDWLKEKIDNSSLFARDGDYDLASVGR
ncbi:hypothetical protein RHMOL_Rhmol12G0100300 [Rhododendron molle]|uniref:Uncharacterized protein n=1 Tax=Rhododendron molle TaxID=49168 RepID=A0ACC0LHZ6_RHOML|nr:hypothetical protein RHMOL_Rhmol12G0100300 [Rhododendron molle]